MHVAVGGAQSRMSKQLLHHQRRDTPLVSPERREGVPERMLGEMRDAQALGNRVDVPLNQVAVA